MILQRAVLLCTIIILFLEIVVFVEVSGDEYAFEIDRDITRRKREADDDDLDLYYSDEETYFGTGIAIGFGAGFPFFDHYPRRSIYNPFRPLSGFPRFPTIIHWHNGPHVCNETEYADEPDAFQKLSSGMDKPYAFGQSSQESCSDNNNVKICRGTMFENDKMKMYMTKYYCCEGYERSYRRPGCVAAGSQKEAEPDMKENPDMTGNPDMSGHPYMYGYPYPYMNGHSDMYEYSNEVL